MKQFFSQKSFLVRFCKKNHFCQLKPLHSEHFYTWILPNSGFCTSINVQNMGICNCIKLLQHSLLTYSNMSCQLMNEYSTSIVQHNICEPPSPNTHTNSLSTVFLGLSIGSAKSKLDVELVLLLHYNRLNHDKYSQSVSGRWTLEHSNFFTCSQMLMCGTIIVEQYSRIDWKCALSQDQIH